MSNLLVTREWYESNKDVVQIKESTTYPGLFVLKYKKKVFYDNLWTPELEQCRGLVVDRDFNVVVRPFDKIFNYGENGTTFDRDVPVVIARKVNGFLGCATNTQKYGTIFSTTGSLDSDYVELVRKNLEGKVEDLSEGVTWCFEICDETDPHIIKEDFGAYLIGAVSHHDGRNFQEQFLDGIAQLYKFKRYESESCLRFSDAVKRVKTVQHEGFVVRLESDEQQILKIKSPYYLVTKFFARKSEGNLQHILDDPHQAKKTLDEEYYPLVDYLSEHNQEFVALDKQGRITFVREFLNG